MFEFYICYPVQQAIRNLDAAKLSTSPCLKYLISGQHYCAFVRATVDSEEAGMPDICDFIPHCQVITHAQVRKTDSSCKCGKKVKHSSGGSPLVKGIISKKYPAESWSKIGPQSWIHPLRISLPHIAAPCTSCCTVDAVYHSCTISVQVIYKKVHCADGDTQECIKMLEDVVFKDDRIFTVLHLPALSVSLINADQNSLLLKVQNIAYSCQVVESLDIFAHSKDGNKESSTNSEDVLSTSCDMRLALKTDVLPLRLLTFEAQTLVFNVDLMNLKPGTLQEYDIHAQLTWRPQDCLELMEQADITWPLLSSVRLSSVEVRHPAFVITAAPNCKQPVIPNTKFSMQYTVDNKLQDLTSLKLVWSPEKAVLERKALEDLVYRQNVSNILNSVVCHQPVLDIGSCIQGTSTRVYVDFTILTPGLYELGQHMKLNIQPSVWGSPSKGSLHAATPPGSPYTTHQQHQAIQNSVNSSHRWNSSPKKMMKPSMLSTSWTKDTSQNPLRWSDLDVAVPVKFTATPKALPPGATNVKSPLTPSGTIIRRSEVLKRNCQILVLDSKEVSDTAESCHKY